jgi:hypothetical protein
MPTATPQAPAATAVTKPQVQASNGLNVRGGPSTDYPVVGALNGGEAADIVAKNPDGDWWEVTLTTGGTGWVYGALVQTEGDTAAIAIASDIPPAPPTATPAPVAVQALYGAQEIYVTGSQGKGDGQSEFVLGSGQGVKIVRDADGREVTSDVVDGLSTHSPDIAHSDLIAAGYCRDDADCDRFNKSLGCWGHHSWSVTFQRKY